ncbi:MAG: hypothetical protein R2690_20110 [Acidimicrobiales bacterium]
MNLGSDGSGSEWRPMPAAEEGKPRILIVGDSQAYVLGLGIERWDDRTGEAVVWSNALAGCGIVRGGEVNFPVDTTSCEDWDRRWSEAVAAFDSDVVVVMSGGWDWIERKLPEWDDFKFYGDPVFDQYLVDEYVEAVDVLSDQRGASPWFDNACYELQDFGEDPTHMNEDLIPALQAQRPDVVDIIEFHDLVCPNGVHQAAVRPRGRPAGRHAPVRPGVGHRRRLARPAAARAGRPGSRRALRSASTGRCRASSGRVRDRQRHAGRRRRTAAEAGGRLEHRPRRSGRGTTPGSSRRCDTCDRPACSGPRGWPRSTSSGSLEAEPRSPRRVEPEEKVASASSTRPPDRQSMVRRTCCPAA